MKLTATQIDLLKALQGGARLCYMAYVGRKLEHYFFVTGTMKRCTVAANKLIEYGLVANVSHTPFKTNYVLTEAGKNWKP